MVLLLRALVLLRTTAALRLRLSRLLVQRVARLEARDDAQLNLAAHELFDIHPQRPVVEGDQRHGFS